LISWGADHESTVEVQRVRWEIKSPTFHILDDLNTTSYFELSNFFDCEIKSRKCPKIKIMKNFRSLIFLLPQEKKGVNIWSKSFIFCKNQQKAHTLHFDTNNQFLISVQAS